MRSGRHAAGDRGRRRRSSSSPARRASAWSEVDRATSALGAAEFERLRAEGTALRDVEIAALAFASAAFNGCFSRHLPMTASLFGPACQPSSTYQHGDHRLTSPARAHAFTQSPWPKPALHALVRLGVESHALGRARGAAVICGFIQTTDLAIDDSLTCAVLSGSQGVLMQTGRRELG